jgi:hypothetical protein
MKENIEKLWYIEANVPYYIVQEESETIGKDYIQSAWEIAYFQTKFDAFEYVVGMIPEMKNSALEYEEVGEKLIGINVLKIVENEKCQRIVDESVLYVPYK